MARSSDFVADSAQEKIMKVSIYSKSLLFGFKPGAIMASRVLRFSLSEGDAPISAQQFGASGPGVINLAEMMSESDSCSDTDCEMVPCQTDFCEVFSPPRVCFALAPYGLQSHLSFDLLSGWDFTTLGDRAKCLRMVHEHRPKWMMLSPPCTMYSPLQALFNLHKMSEAEKEARFKEANVLLDFSMALAMVQMRKGAYFCFEHPQKASSWQRHTVQAVANSAGTFCVDFDQCQTGLRAPEPDCRPIRKRTRLMTNCPAVRTVFSPLQCTCPPGTHCPIEGSIAGISLSKWCQVYTRVLCEKLAESVARALQPHHFA